MKDKNGIEIDCENCRYCKYCDDKFYLMDDLSDCFNASNEAYEARIAELQAENALLKESRFTNNELNLIRNTFQAQIREDKCGGA